MYTILVAEDDENLRNTLNEVLIHEKYKVLLAENGLNAYKIILKNNPDLIISDIQMPYLDGIELLKKLQNNPNTASVPFIFLTAETEIQKRDEAMSIGALGYIIKPFNLIDLLDAIKSNLEKEKIKV